MGSEDTAGAGEAVEQEILGQHRRLEEQFAAMETALRGGAAPEEVRTRFDALRAGAERHFEQEDALYYPTIASLRREHRPMLAELTREHERFRRRFADLDAALAGEEMERFQEGFVRLVGDFGRHEAEEERMLAALDREIAASP